VSRAIHVPPDLDREALERQRFGVERLLVHLSEEAEAWAGTGSHRPGEARVRKEPSRHARRSAVLPGPTGVSLDDELDRFGLRVTPCQSDRPAA
jgi:hypothetical protein